MAGRNVNLKKAPRRKIVDISRIGAWGRVEYHHKLECGHVEARKRAQTAETMACSGCVLSEEYEKRSEAPPEDPNEEILDFLGSELAVNEKTAQSLKVEIGRAMNLTTDAIEVVLDIDEQGQQALSGAVILLSADEVLRIVSQTVETSDE